MAIPALTDVLPRTRAGEDLGCPSCRAGGARRWGCFGGRQRYRCRTCHRTFTEFTGTPVAYLKKARLLPAFLVSMIDGLSVRAAALAVGIHPSTSFRWRHRICRELVQRRERIAGRIEVFVLRQPESLKGQRRMPRPARRRQKRRMIAGVPTACVLICVDRTDRVAAGLAGMSPLRPPDVAKVLDPSLDGGPPIVHALEGWRGPIARFVRSRGGVFHDERRGRSPAIQRVESAHAYARRFARWLIPFSGVATKYLDHYLAWHRTLDAVLRSVVMPSPAAGGRASPLVV